MDHYQACTERAIGRYVLALSGTGGEVAAIISTLTDPANIEAHRTCSCLRTRLAAAETAVTRGRKAYRAGYNVDLEALIEDRDKLLALTAQQMQDAADARGTSR